MAEIRKRCAHCGESIMGRHVVGAEGFTYCNDECADAGWRERGADLWAASEDDYDPRWMTSYEDLMEDRGATIADYHYCERMSDYA